MRCNIDFSLFFAGHQAPISTSTALGGNPLSQNGGSQSAVQQAINGGGFPPKSQIKRQKMVYHCKFGEFGVLEGQFTEPSGKGSFNNYVDRILNFFDHPPTHSKQSQ